MPKLDNFENENTNDVNKTMHSVSIDTKDVNEIPNTTSNYDDIWNKDRKLFRDIDYILKTHHTIPLGSDKDAPYVARLVAYIKNHTVKEMKLHGIEQRLDEVEETKYAIMRGEYASMMYPHIYSRKVSYNVKSSTRQKEAMLQHKHTLTKPKSWDRTIQYDNTVLPEIQKVLNRIIERESQ